MIRRLLATSACMFNDASPDSFTSLSRLDCSQPLYFSSHAKEKASEASVKHAGVGASSSLAILSARSTIDSSSLGAEHTMITMTKDRTNYMYLIPCRTIFLRVLLFCGLSTILKKTKSPQLSLCHGIFTDSSIFGLLFREIGQFRTPGLHELA